MDVKCPKCGYSATWTETGPDTGELSNVIDMYTICPVITERANEGDQTNLSQLDCSEFHAATSKAVREYRRHRAQPALQPS